MVLDEHGGAFGRDAQQRIGQRDDALCGAGVDGPAFIQILVLDMWHGGQRFGVDGTMHQQIDAPPTFVDRQAHALQAFFLGDVEGNQRGRAACCLNGVIQFFEATDGAGQRNHMCAAFGQLNGRCISQTARCAGDEGNCIRRDFHIFSLSA